MKKILHTLFILVAVAVSTDNTVVTKPNNVGWRKYKEVKPPAFKDNFPVK